LIDRKCAPKSNKPFAAAGGDSGASCHATLLSGPFFHGRIELKNLGFVGLAALPSQKSRRL